MSASTIKAGRVLQEKWALPWLSKSSDLYPWILAIILVNFLLINGAPHGGDIGYWKSWVRQLQLGGYLAFEGDYPPVYIHWLYLVGKIYSALSIAVEPNSFLKFLAQVPVLTCHCLLAVITARWAEHCQLSREHAQRAMALVCFNPALLVDGPLWGQVDILPTTFVVVALFFALVKRRMDIAVPLFVLSLLTKFQMIAFAPVFGVLALRQFKLSLLGALYSLVVVLLAFLPFLVVGKAVDAFTNAYIHTLGSYPKATFNGANLWFLLAGNMAPDDLNIFTGEAGGFWVVKHTGMLAFALVCLLVFATGVYRQWRCAAGESPVAERSAEALLYALVCASAFFVILPAMHERYMMPAVVIAMFYGLLVPWGFYLALVLALVSSLNMMLVFGVSGPFLWQSLAAMSVLILLVLMLVVFLGQARVSRGFHRLVDSLRRPIVAIVVAALLLWGFAYYLHQSYRVLFPELQEGQKLLRQFPILDTRQSHGVMRINSSFDGNILSVAGTRYREGIGVHADSVIVFDLDGKAARLSIMAGVDDEVGAAEVEFSIREGADILWQSGPVFGYEREPVRADIDVSGVDELSLVVSARGTDSWDHADWINPVITLAE
ncbi:NPCBM/NEW2 domain-containing protein [Gilvimarinus algae]|uniref:NPCBM/NEW2 domain-containing protein n=1 Tax=Gilvimarinus algae TaxID=3058037 RepID=A0ABT8TGC9_9GAMM|nr:NPCBM/NEW2 domain-containing protein [Gilvimarinus sp. SDUM040014]MDO3382183.1 NPCBM/NEW2 domain-containing protein [Gilvimarinus sp. SDUM040014]